MADGDDGDDDCILFSPHALTPEVFGAFSGRSEFQLDGAAPCELHIVQTIVSGEVGESVLLWNSAVALSRAWWNNRSGLPPVCGHRCLDLGAGLGVCSLTAASLGAEAVVATEVDPALAALHASIARNAHSPHQDRITIADLPWGVGAEEASLGTRPWDVVMGTDLVYNKGLHGILLATLRHVLTPGVTTLVLAYEERGGEDAFFEAAERELGVVGECIDASDNHAELVRIFIGRRHSHPSARGLIGVVSNY